MQAKPFVDGHWRDDGRAGYDVHTPGSGNPVTAVREARPSDVEDAITAALRAFEAARALPAFERAKWLRATADGIGAHAAELAAAIVAEVGKPVQLARAEVERARLVFTLAAEEATRLGGELVPLEAAPAGAGKLGIVRRFARGPVAAITPFNFPLNLAAHKLAPALACGAPVLWKPAPEGPGTAALLVTIMERAGVPAGMLALLPAAHQTAAPLIDDARVRVLSFTGSAAAGWALKARAPRKQVLLELGGDAFAIVEPDADLELATRKIVQGAFAYSGQICIAVQHVLAARAIAGELRERILAATRAVPIGDATVEGTQVVPLIRKQDADRVVAWKDEALAAGARLLAGGGRSGDTVEPTWLERVPEEVRLAREEVFGPVKTFAEYGDVEEAFARVGRSPWGLQASLFTRDVRTLMRAHERLEVGAVIHDEWPLFRVDSMPYGGSKGSGWGREGLRYAIEEFTEPRMLVLSRG